jgi:hypothetical protein
VAAALVIACNAWLVLQALASYAAPAMLVALGTFGLAAATLLAYLAFAPMRFRPDALPVQTHDRRACSSTARRKVSRYNGAPRKGR